MKIKFKKLIASVLAAGILSAALPAVAADINTVVDGGEGKAEEVKGNVWLGHGYDFDIKEGGYFRLEYSASQETDVHLVFQKDNGEAGWSWDQLTTVSDSGAVVESENTYYIEFDYDDILSFITEKGYGAVSDIAGIQAETWGLWDNEAEKRVSCPVTILTVEWINPGDEPSATEEPSETSEPVVTSKPTEIPIVSKIEINEVIDADESTETADMTGNIDVSHIGIAEGGSIRITYSCEAETSIALVLRDSNWEGWTQYNTPDKKGKVNDDFYVEFSYDTLVKDWQGEDFTDVTYANVKTWGVWDDDLKENVSKTATILSIEWINVFEPVDTTDPQVTNEPQATSEPEPTEIPIVSKIEINETIDADEATDASDMTGNINVGHTGIAEGGRFRVTYTCDTETSIALVLRDSNWEGWTQYNTPDKTGTIGGAYYVDFTYDTLTKEWQGTDFSDVTYANVKTWGVWDDDLKENVSKTATILSIEWIDEADLYNCKFTMENGTVAYSSTWTEECGFDFYIAVYDADDRQLNIEMNRAAGVITADGAAYAKAYFWSDKMEALAEPVTAGID